MTLRGMNKAEQKDNFLEVMFKLDLEEYTGVYSCILKKKKGREWYSAERILCTKAYK